MRDLVVLVAVIGCGGGASVPPVDAPCGGGARGEVTADIAYASGASDPHLQSLDVYRVERPAACGPAPIVVWVHGGAWAIGDKAGAIDDKVALFNGAGYVFVSVNYRLSPAQNPPTFDPGRIMHPSHVQDVAAAIHWVRTHAAELGGDPDRIVLLGHSAGAHLVALVSTDPQYLAAHGDPLTLIRCTASYDTEAYDIPRALASSNAQQRAILENAFGMDATVQAMASPMNHASTAGAPRFQIVTRGDAARRASQQAFADALADARVIDAQPLTHEEVNAHIGAAGDTIMTQPTMTFFAECVAR